jgi:metal-responsive CopG/Arc/MetJ family transcriptional regulator
MIKTSITLSKDVIALFDQRAEGKSNRSAFIELAVRTYLQILKQKCAIKMIFERSTVFPRSSTRKLTMS